MRKLILGSAFILGAIAFGKSQELKVTNFENNTVDYGSVQKGSDGKRVIKIKNTGDKPLIISNAVASCGCTVPKWPTEPIAPGKKGEIEVTYNTAIPGKFTKSVTINSNDSNNPQIIIKIKGDVINSTPVTAVKN